MWDIPGDRSPSWPASAPERPAPVSSSLFSMVRKELGLRVVGAAARGGRLCWGGTLCGFSLGPRDAVGGWLAVKLLDPWLQSRFLANCFYLSLYLHVKRQACLVGVSQPASGGLPSRTAQTGSCWLFGFNSSRRKQKSTCLYFCHTLSLLYINKIFV